MGKGCDVCSKEKCRPIQFKKKEKNSMVGMSRGIQEDINYTNNDCQVFFYGIYFHSPAAYRRQLKLVFYTKPRRGGMLQPRASPWVSLSDSSEPCKGVI